MNDFMLFVLEIMIFDCNKFELGGTFIRISSFHSQNATKNAQAKFITNHAEIDKMLLYL